MQNLTRKIREKFHPLYHIRRFGAGRFVLRQFDRPAWLAIPGVSFKVRARLLTHGVAYSMIGSSEVNPEALALECVRQFGLRSFWDVGANFGYYAWLMKSANPNLEIVLIEPLPQNAELIRDTIQRNRFRDATLIVAAASAGSGNGVLHADQIAGATSSLESQESTFEERHLGVASRALQVSLISIDEASTGHRPIDFIKLDVEGHEESALRGATQAVARYQPILLVECGHPAHSCLNVLESQGYRILDADHLSLNCSPGTLNYFCLPPRLAASAEGLLEAARAHHLRRG